MDLSKLVSEINKKYGGGTLMDFSKPESIKSVETITTGLPSLDMILCGGMPKGRIMEVYGPEGSGKTTFSLHMIAKAQINEPKKKVAFIDVEHAFNPEYAKVLGVDFDNLFFSQPNSGEEALDIVEKLCESGLFSIIVLDSTAMLVPMAVKAKEIDGTANIATTARLLSQTLPRITSVASKSDTTLIFINQLRTNIGQMYGNPEVVPGGKAMKFASSVRLELRGKKAEERNGKEGSPVKVTVKKNKIGPPFRSTELFLTYGEGFDALDDTLSTAVTLGLIKKSGGWFEYETVKAHGWVPFMGAIQKEPELLDKLLELLKDIKI